MNPGIDPKLAHLQAQVRAELNLISQIVQQFERDWQKHGDQLEDSLVLAGFAHMAQSYYTGCENLFLLISRHFENSLPSQT